VTSYVVDTSVWITAWRHYPPDVDLFAPFWDGVGRMIKAGLLCSPEEVRVELEKGTDGLAPYLKKIDGLFHPFDEEHQLALIEVQKVVSLVDPDSDRNRADPFVVSLAKAKDGTVVSDEWPRKHKSGRPKIPDACKQFAIPCVRLLEFLKTEPWT
jgi:hypothetical protein